MEIGLGTGQTQAQSKKSLIKTVSRVFASIKRE